MKYIYVYTTESFRAKDWYKIGESINQPHKRIAAQDTAASPEPLLILHSWVVDNGTTDKSIHSILEDSGFNRLRKGREWFELSSDPVADITVAIKDLGKIITESTAEITYTADARVEPIVYSIPHVNELWWAMGIGPEQSMPKQLEFTL